MEDKPKETPKQRVHRSGLPKPPANQLPHDTGVVKNSPEITEDVQQPYDQSEEQVQQLPESANQEDRQESKVIPADQQHYERRS